MFDRIVIISLIILLKTNNSYSQNIFNEFVIVLKENSFNKIIIPKFYYGTSTNVYANYKLSASDENLNVTNLQIFAQGGSDGCWFNIASYVNFRIELTDLNLIIEDNGKGDTFASNIICDVSSVSIDNQTIILDQAYFHDFIGSPWDIGTPIDKHYYLEKAILSDNQKWIGGIVLWYEVNNESHEYYYTYTINIWDSVNGELLFRCMPDNDTMSMLKTVEIFFLLHDRYFLYRNTGTPTYKNVFPSAYLLDMETFDFIPVDRDLAFTSDDRYYVTGRDGLPSLVETATHEVIQRYDPGSPMTACCFSPDDRTLYIACEDLQIYAFDSHLPSDTHAWELFE